MNLINSLFEIIEFRERYAITRVSSVKYEYFACTCKAKSSNNLQLEFLF